MKRILSRLSFFSLFLAPLFVAQVAFASFDFQIGETVISSNGWTGVVQGIYPNGNLSVYFKGSSEGRYQMNPNLLARTYGSVGDLSVGDSVISANGWMGEIHGIYFDGNVSVYFKGSSNGRYQMNPSSLARTKGMSGGFNVGDNVISSNGWRGVVQGVYPNGNLSVYYKGSSLGRYQQAPSMVARTRP